MIKFTLIKKYLGKMTTEQKQLALFTFRELWAKYDIQVKYYRELMSKQAITQNYYRRVTATQRKDLVSRLRSNLKVIASL